MIDDWKTRAVPASYAPGVSAHPVAPVALEVPSTPNLREHWRARAKRSKAQRAAMARAVRAIEVLPVLQVTLTRVGRRPLDDDNLIAALKACRDGVADALRIDDASPLVQWGYRQRVGEPGVEWALESLCGRDASGRVGK